MREPLGELTRISHEILGKIDGIGFWIAPQESLDSVPEHDQGHLRARRKQRLSSLLREMVRNPG